jgi:hypothetical protein
MSHSGISGSQAACASPELFAADHALHQRSEPSHPLNGYGARFLLKPGSISGYSQRVHNVTITCVIQSFIWSMGVPHMDSAGFEPAASGLQSQRSYQLSHEP